MAAELLCQCVSIAGYSGNHDAGCGSTVTTVWAIVRIVRGLEASTSDHAMSRVTVNSIQTCASTAEHAGHGMLLITYHPYEGVLLFVNCELSFSA